MRLWVFLKFENHMIAYVKQKFSFEGHLLYEFMTKPSRFCSFCVLYNETNI